MKSTKEDTSTKRDRSGSSLKKSSFATQPEAATSSVKDYKFERVFYEAGLELKGEDKYMMGTGGGDGDDANFSNWWERDETRTATYITKANKSEPIDVDVCGPFMNSKSVQDIDKGGCNKLLLCITVKLVSMDNLQLDLWRRKSDANKEL